MITACFLSICTLSYTNIPAAHFTHSPHLLPIATVMVTFTIQDESGESACYGGLFRVSLTLLSFDSKHSSCYSLSKINYNKSVSGLRENFLVSRKVPCPVAPPSSQTRTHIHLFPLAMADVFGPHDKSFWSISLILARFFSLRSISLHQHEMAAYITYRLTRTQPLLGTLSTHLVTPWSILFRWGTQVI